MSDERLRIAFTGPECSGKTTLSVRLHAHLGGTLVPEYARHYLSQLPVPYEQDDLDAIALGQMRSWMTAQERPVICDTDMSVIYVWSLEKYGEVSDLIQMLLHKQQFDRYLLCRPDIPWVADPMRENPDDRARLFERYVELFDSLDRPYHIIEGLSENERWKKVRDAVS